MNKVELMTLVGFAVLLLFPVVGWAGFRYGRSVRGGLALGALLLGIGQPLDPPPKQRVEWSEPGRDVRPPGDPPAAG